MLPIWVRGWISRARIQRNSQDKLALMGEEENLVRVEWFLGNMIEAVQVRRPRD